MSSWQPPSQPDRPDQPDASDQGRAPAGGSPQQWSTPPEPTQQLRGPGAFTAEERNWAVAAHAGSFVAAYVALGLIAPLVVLLVKGKDSAYVRAHAVESLNFQLTALIAIIVSAVLILVLIGFVMLAVVGIFYLVVVILATVKASQGEMFRYPLTIRFIS